MKYEELVGRVAPYPFFGEELLDTWGEGRAAQGVQLNRWVKTGKLIRLKRGLYSLPPERQKTQFSTLWLANALYSPSYISLESVLFLKDMIPERVYPITSVSLLKTAKFENFLGRFVYRHIKKEFFFGLEEVKDTFNRPVLMATKEKALLDFIYFYHRWESNADFLENNLRLQQLEQLDKKLFMKLGRQFQMKKIDQAVDVIKTFI